MTIIILLSRMARIRTALAKSLWLLGHATHGNFETRLAHVPFAGEDMNRSLCRIFRPDNPIPCRCSTSVESAYGRSGKRSHCLKACQGSEDHMKSTNLSQPWPVFTHPSLPLAPNGVPFVLCPFLHPSSIAHSRSLCCFPLAPTPQVACTGT